MCVSRPPSQIFLGEWHTLLRLRWKSSDTRMLVTYYHTMFSVPNFLGWVTYSAAALEVISDTRMLVTILCCGSLCSHEDVKWYITLLWVTIALPGLYFGPRYYVVGHFIPTRMLLIYYHTMLWVTIALLGLYFGSNQFLSTWFCGLFALMWFLSNAAIKDTYSIVFSSVQYCFWWLTIQCSPLYLLCSGAVHCWFSISSSDRRCLAYCWAIRFVNKIYIELTN